MAHLNIMVVKKSSISLDIKIYHKGVKKRMKFFDKSSIDANQNIDLRKRDRLFYPFFVLTENVIIIISLKFRIPILRYLC